MAGRATPDRRIVVITGANSGIGKAAAARFAAGGHHVVCAVRDVRRGAQALAEITAGVTQGSAEVIELDVSSFDSIRRFRDAFAARHDRLDALIHNAGYFNHGIRRYQYSTDGVELTFATNVFGPFLLTELLLAQLGAAADARVLTAGSTAVKTFFDPKRAIEFDNLRGEHADSRPYTVYRMYGDSKMGLLLLTRRMAAAYAHRGIAVNCVMIPTVRVEKEVLQKFTSWFRIVGPVVQYWNPLALPPARLAETYYRMCTAGELRGLTGALVDHTTRVIPPIERAGPLSPLAVARELIRTRHAPPYAADPDNQARMWQLAHEVTADWADPS